MKSIFALLMMAFYFSACSENHLSQGEFSGSPESEKAIVGGQDVTSDDSRSDQVALITGKNAEGQTYTCSGTLIAPDLVLTAAHCIGTLDTIKVVFGTNPLGDEATQIVTIKDARIHKQFNKDLKIRNDVGLLQLKVSMPAYYSLTLLPWTQSRNISVRSGDTVETFGFGVASGLLKNGKIDGKTAGVMRETSLKVIETSAAGDVFTADQTHGTGICSGDSGGPVYINGNFVGITSHAITDDPSRPQSADNDICNYQSVFTNVVYYKNWIEGAIKSLHSK